MPPQLTDIERKILDYMVQYLRSNTYQPSIREIGERFGIKSTKTVSEHLQALADKGFLERDPSRSRGVRILGVDLHADTVSVPCYRDFPKPGPERGGDSAEMFLTVDRRMTGGKGGFFVRINGEELAVLGVQDGDYLLVEPTSVDELEEGAVIVARTGPGPTFHRFSRNGSGVYLQSLRAGESPTLVEDPAKIPLVGRVSALYRRMDGAGAGVSLTAH